jgi:hypothetical protein
MSNGACHLDLIPFATARKWTELPARQRSSLLYIAGNTLGVLLRDSPIQILILNGMSVVQQFQDITDVRLERQVMTTWSLPRQSKTDVVGIAFSGVVDTISGIMLERKVLVLGFNHNIQSSFGVTTDVVHEIHNWIVKISAEITQ